VAFRSIRTCKNFAAGIVAICILSQIGGTAAVHFAGVLEEAPAQAQVAATQAQVAAEGGAATQPDTAAAGPESIWRQALRWGLPATRFAAVVACVLLVVMVMFAVTLSLVERVGGVAGFIAAFNWSVILLLMLVPWKPILGSSLSCGALFNLAELETAHCGLGEAPDLVSQAMFYGRFGAYPIVALLVSLIVQFKFARGYSVANFAPPGSPPESQAAVGTSAPPDPGQYEME